MDNPTVMLAPVGQNAEMVIIAALILVGVAVFTVTNFIYQRRQAKALTGIYEIDCARYFYEVRKRRDEAVAADMRVGGLAWIAKQIRDELGLDIILEGEHYVLKSLPVFAAVTRSGALVVVSPHEGRDLRKRLGKIVKQSGTVLGSFLDEKSVLELVRQAESEFVRSLRHNEYFDMHATAVARELGVGWDQPTELHFLVSVRGALNGAAADAAA
jgi:hypothetical protein